MLIAANAEPDRQERTFPRGIFGDLRIRPRVDLWEVCNLATLDDGPSGHGSDELDDKAPPDWICQPHRNARLYSWRLSEEVPRGEERRKLPLDIRSAAICAFNGPLTDAQQPGQIALPGSVRSHGERQALREIQLELI